MPNHNPTIHNYLCNSIEFNKTTPDLSITTLPHGSDATVEFAHIPIFPTNLNFSGVFAIHAWIKPHAGASIHARIIQTPARGVNGVTNAFMFGLLGDDTFYGTVNNALRIGMGIHKSSSSQDVKVTCLPVLRPDIWHHIVGQVVTGEPNFIEIYVDGCKAELIDHVDLDYTLLTNSTNPVTGLMVGWDANLEGPFKGNIASLAIFNRSLTSEEIKTLAMGTANLTGVKSTLKSTVVAWWKMGDKDPVGLATLNDAVGTNHLTTVNMSEANRLTDVPAERPRQHQNLHISTGCDEIKFDPNGVGCSFIWDSFPTIDAGNAFPFGWFGAKETNDKFERVNLAGRMSVLRFNKDDEADVMFITNVETGSVGNTFKFGPSEEPDFTEYCMEFVARSNGDGSGEGTGAGTHFFGFIEDPHGDLLPVLQMEIFLIRSALQFSIHF